MTRYMKVATKEGGLDGTDVMKETVDLAAEMKGLRLAEDEQSDEETIQLGADLLIDDLLKVTDLYSDADAFGKALLVHNYALHHYNERLDEQVDFAGATHSCVSAVLVEETFAEAESEGAPSKEMKG